MFGLVYVKRGIALKPKHLVELLIKYEQQNILAAQLGQLHALLEQVVLPLALSVVAKRVVLDQGYLSLSMRLLRLVLRLHIGH